MKWFACVLFVVFNAAYVAAQDTITYPVSHHYENVPAILQNRAFEEREYALALQKYLLKFNLDSTVRPVVIKTRHPNLFLIPVSVALAALAIEQFTDASFYRDLGADDKAGGRTMVGIACSLTSIISLIGGLQTEQWVVYSNGTSMRVEYSLK